MFLRFRATPLHLRSYLFRCSVAVWWKHILNPVGEDSFGVASIVNPSDSAARDTLGDGLNRPGDRSLQQCVLIASVQQILQRRHCFRLADLPQGFNGGLPYFPGVIRKCCDEVWRGQRLPNPANRCAAAARSRRRIVHQQIVSSLSEVAHERLWVESAGAGVKPGMSSVDVLQHCSMVDYC